MAEPFNIDDHPKFRPNRTDRPAEFDMDAELSISLPQAARTDADDYPDAPADSSPVSPEDNRSPRSSNIFVRLYHRITGQSRE